MLLLGRVNLGFEVDPGLHTEMLQKTAGIVTLIHRGHVVFINDSGAEMLGYSSKEMVGKNFLDFVHPEDRGRVEDCYNSIVTGLKAPGGYDVRLLTRSGEVLVAEVRASLLDYEGGKGLLVVGVDVTEKKKLEEEFLRLKELYETVLNLLDEGVWVEDVEGCCTYCNPKLARMLGYTQEELLGKHWREVTHPDYHERVARATETRRRGEISSYEAVLLTRDGRSLPVIIAATPIFQKQKFIGVVAAIVDISKIKEAEKRIKEAVRLKEFLVSVLGHDLKNKLSIILGCCGLIPSSTGKPVLEYCDMIKDSAEKMLELIKNAMVYSKIEASKGAPVTLSTENLSDLIKNSIEDVKQKAKTKKVLIKFEPKEEWFVKASPFVDNILTNLLDNAIKYSPEGSTVEVGVEDAGDYWRVAVKDRGRGVPDHLKEKIFTRFERGELLSGIEGSGLGLAIVKEAVAQHGGKTWVEDNPGGGSIFYVELPKAEREKEKG